MACTTLFTTPNTLLQCLQLCARLKDSTVKSEVIQKLNEYLQDYCDSVYLNNLTSNSGYMDSVFLGASNLLNAFLKGASSGQTPPPSDPAIKCGAYNNLGKHAEHPHCVSRIVHSIVTMLPQMYSALYFLYFNVSTDFIKNTPKGGTWTGHKLDGSDKELVQWLRDQIGETSMTGIMPRGFNDVTLKQNTQGHHVYSDLQKFIGHDSAMGLQKALCGLMFVSDWSDALTQYALLGHALLFLYEFCKQVDEQIGREEESGQKSDFLNQVLKALAQNPALSQVLDVVHKIISDIDLNELRSVCSTLKSSLLPFIKGTKTNISAVCQQNTELYNGVLGSAEKFPAHFPYYVQWLCGVTTMPDLPYPEPSSGSSPPTSFLSSITAPFIDAFETVLTSYEAARDFLTGRSTMNNLARIILSLYLMKHECYSAKWDLTKLSTASTAGPFKYGFVPKQNATWDNIKKNLPNEIDRLVQALESLNDVLKESNVWIKATAGGTVGATAGVGGTVGVGAYAYSQYGSTVTPGVSALLDDVASFGFSVSDLAGAGLHCPLQ